MEELLVLGGLALLTVPVMVIVALVMIAGLRRRVTDLEQTVEVLRGDVAARAFPEAASSVAVAPAPAPREADDRVRPVPMAAPRPASVTQAAAAIPPPLPPRDATRVADVRVDRPTPPQAAAPPRPTVPSPPSPIEIAIRTVKRWFTTGNVPVKVGMLVLFAGVAALLKYASDQGFLTLPIELRLAAIAAAAIAGLVFAWRRRESHRAFALSLQGGMIGILLLVVVAAAKLYPLLTPGVAFAASVLLIAGAGVLAVLQNAKALAVFAVLAGFLAPIWLSTGGGHHVALFAYYAMLNAAILGIAWFKPWRVLNLLGFAFTFGIGTVWGVLDYNPAKFASTQPFLVLFFLFYLMIPLLYARRMPASRRDLIDGCLVFGTPLVAFSLQAALLRDNPLGLALCALAVGAVYAALAWSLLRRESVRALAQSYALLAVGFATLAVPLALSAQATACAFALEGAALIWLGLRQQRGLPQLSGIALQIAAAVALAIAVDAAPGAIDTVPFLHDLFVGALLIAASGFASAWCWRAAGQGGAARVAYLWGLAWWIGTWTFEILRIASDRSLPDALLLLAGATGWLAAELHRRRPANVLGGTLLAALVAAVPLALWQNAAHGEPFAGAGALSWLAFAAFGIRGLVCLRAGDGRLASAAQFVWWLLWPLVASLALHNVATRLALGAGWQAVALALPWLVLAAVSLRRWTWLSTPLGMRFDPMRMPLQATLFVVLAVWWLASLRLAGGSAPLPWIAIANPLDVAQIAALLLAARWLWSDIAPDGLRALRVPLVAGLAFLLVTTITLRGAHHWGGVAWDAGLASSSLAQTSLTVVWSILGVLGWVIGSRRGQRALWLAGAVLMAIVLAKLVLVDRGHLGNLWGIGSFIAYGLLCTVVGFFAPAPPRAAEHAEVPA